jgi:hypothetical protein
MTTTTFGVIWFLTKKTTAMSIRIDNQETQPVYQPPVLAMQAGVLLKKIKLLKSF